MTEPEYNSQTCFFCDLDLDPMTLIQETDLDILKRYLPTKNAVSGSRRMKVTEQTGKTDRNRQTDRHTDRREQTHYRRRLTHTSISTHSIVVFTNISFTSSNVLFESFHAVPQLLVLPEAVNCLLSINLHLSGNLTHQTLHVCCVVGSRRLSTDVHCVYRL